MKKNNSQVQVLEPEVEEIPLEQVIDNTLQKANVTDTVINELKTKYGSLRLKSIEDKESFLEVKEARKVVRSVGILVEKICKKGREDAIAIQRKWLKKEDEIMDKIMTVQLPLDDDIEKFENEVERKEKEEKNRQEEQYIKRQSVLSRMGATYDNGSFVLNHISYEVDLIRQSEEEVWNEIILPKYRKEFEDIEAVKVAEENKRKEEQESLRKQQEELQRQQKELQEAQQKMQRDKDELERQQRLDTERKEKEQRDKEAELINSRLKQLNAVYWDGRSATYGNVVLLGNGAKDLALMDDKQFGTFRDTHNARAESDKKEIEAQHLKEIEESKQAAIKKALEDEEKRKQDAEAKRLLELDVASDKVKYEDVLKHLKATPVHLMKSPTYKGKMNAINIFIAEL